jgi:hypothetical protein
MKFRNHPTSIFTFLMFDGYEVFREAGEKFNILLFNNNLCRTLLSETREALKSAYEEVWC